jgi:hypothetical protein
MKKLLPLLAFVFLLVQAGAQTTDYLPQKEFQVEKKKIYDGINAAKKQVAEARKVNTKNLVTIDSLKLVLTGYAGQNAAITDSLAKTKAQLLLLQDKVDNQKMLSRGSRILILAILVILFILVFGMIFMFRRKAEAGHRELLERDKDTNDRMDNFLETVNAKVTETREKIDQFSKVLTDRIDTLGEKIERKIQDHTAEAGERFSKYGSDIQMVKDELGKTTRSMEEMLIAHKKDDDLKHQGIGTQAKKFEEEINALKAKK